VGIDAGAVATKLVIVKDDMSIIASAERATTMEPGKLSARMLEETIDAAGLSRDEIGYIVATGQGRRSVDIADLARTEITAFARGAHFLSPDSEIVVDMGGHGIRVMRMGEMGIVSDFRTNDKCSSGTGCFMDTMAAALEVSIGEVGERSLHSRMAEHVNASCTVFAESEVVSLIAKGKATDDILAGLNSMVARKIIALVNATRCRGKVLLCGGVARNRGVINEIGKEIDRELEVPEEPHLVGALGAVLLSPRKRKIMTKEEAPVKAEAVREPFLKRFLRWSA